MKKCKKIISLVLIFLLSTTLNVHAADYSGIAPEVTFTPDANSAKVGETINITLSAKCETEISGVEGILDWDNTKLEFVNQNGFVNEGFQNASGVNEATGEYNLYIASNTFPKEANMATLTFKVLEAAEVDEVLSIKLSDITLYDTNLDEFPITDQEVKITIVANETEGGEQNPGDGEQDPGDGEQNPGDGEQDPGDEEQKDQSTADKPFNDAGLETYGVIGLAAIMLSAIVLYAKCRKYRDVN